MYGPHESIAPLYSNFKPFSLQAQPRAAVASHSVALKESAAESSDPLAHAKAVVILAKTSAITYAVASKAYIEAQVPILKASAAKLTALEMAGIAVASVLALTILKGLMGGSKSREPMEAGNKAKEPTEAELAGNTAATLARVEVLGLGQAVTPMSVSSIMNTIRAVQKQQDDSLADSSCAHHPSPGPMIALFRGSPGSVSASVRVLLDFPWSAGVAAAAERAQSLALMGEFDGAVQALEKSKKLRQVKL